jgi:Rrf2 family transcriptional regulator, nitric oxide-sensitive transcriptional repressor
MKKLLGSALAAYFKELDSATLADIVGDPVKPSRLRAGAGIVIPIASSDAKRGVKKAPAARTAKRAAR